MPITIGSNIAALRAERRLNEGSATLSRIYERLSSGQRINHASDDAAGLSIASSLRANAKVFAQANRNINDGISALAITEGGMTALSSIVMRISELAEQAANGVYSAAQRVPIDNEAQALRDEFNRIVATTEFNGVKLLDGSSNGIKIQVGIDSSANSIISVGQGYALKTVVGTGTLGSALSIPFTNNALTMRAADLNNDGNADLIISGGPNATSRYSVALGNGDGTFKAAVSGGSYFGYTISLGDMNEDGTLDLLLRNANYGHTAYMPGLGDGSFGAQLTIVSPSGTWAEFSETADFNNDGHLDYIDFDQAGTGGTSAHLVLGNGNGTFKAPLATNTLIGITGEATADFDQNGTEDFIVASSGSSLVYFSGLGDGTFASGLTIAVGDLRGRLTFADFNNDQILDLVASGSNQTSTIVRFGNGDGSFSAAKTVSTGTLGIEASAAADINGDGNVDVISAGDGVVYLSLGNGNGTFKSAVSYASNQSISGSRGGLQAVDFNNDGFLDVAMSSDSALSAEVFIQNTITSYTLGGFSLRTASDARTTLDQMKSYLSTLSSALGEIGASQSRLQVALANNQVTLENSLAAASRIEDADIASESALLTQQQILQQAAAAVLAQANQQPALALQLLRS